LSTQPTTVNTADNSSTASYKFILYITGATHNSTVAVKNITNICEQYLAGKYVLDIIDVYQQPSLAKEKQIIAAPTLIKIKPTPVRRLIGDMSDTAKVLSVLGITKAS
jgi:circadian clock protein KaiB